MEKSASGSASGQGFGGARLAILICPKPLREAGKEWEGHLTVDGQKFRKELQKQTVLCGLLVAQEKSLDPSSAGTKVCHHEFTAHE